MLNLVGAVVSVVTPPFPAFIVALLITGLGAGLNDLSLATYLAHFKNGPMMSIFYAALGVRPTLFTLHDD